MMLAAAHQIPYPSWLNPGDNTWQLVAATLVGLMSLPGLAVLFASLVQRKWSVNVLLMTFTGFALVLVVWVLWGYNMAFGHAIGNGVVTSGSLAVQRYTSSHYSFWTRFFDDFVGMPHPILSHFAEENQAVSGANTVIPYHFPTATLALFQLVFAAITPLLFMGSILSRLKFKAWCLLVPLWITVVYCVDAFLIWGGGYFAQQGALDYSGGFVIHMSAGVSGFVAAWVLGPRLKRDRDHALPNNLVMVAVGAGILWLGWNGFNGGDPYYAGANAAAAVLNTNIATAVALLTWVAMDAGLSRAKKPTFLGAVNGMICGLVGITPCAGWVDGVGAIVVGVACSGVVWFAWNYLLGSDPSRRSTTPSGSSTPTASPGSSVAYCSGCWRTPAWSSTAAPGAVRPTAPPPPAAHRWWPGACSTPAPGTSNGSSSGPPSSSSSGRRS